MLPEDAEERCNDIIKRLNWTGPVFKIAGLEKQGTQELCWAIQEYLDANPLDLNAHLEPEISWEIKAAPEPTPEEIVEWDDEWGLENGAGEEGEEDEDDGVEVEYKR
jgi:GTP-binding protein